MGHRKDIMILRELAKRHAEACARDIQDERRELWRRHNSLVRTRPLIYVRWLAAWHEAPESLNQCEDPFYQQHETFLRQMLFQDTIGDDFILEPWITQSATHVMPRGSLWGPDIKVTRPNEQGGSWVVDPPIKDLADLSALVPPHHVIDEEATARDVARLCDAVGDLLEVSVDRGSIFRMWHADISTDLGYLRGIEQVMYDMIDDPDGLHRLLAFMRDGILRAHEEAEAAGDWRLCNHQNQAMSYARELADPRANSDPVRRKDLWCFTAAQELTLVSPEMHDEFMLRYQAPIMERFGLSAYGCCEDLTRKIDYLRKIKNLRRIAVVPRADVARCAEQIGQDYVFSWRPNPAEMVCCGFDEARVRKIVGEAMEAAKGCYVDISLKDVQTVGGDPSVLRRWVRTVREITDRY